MQTTLILDRKHTPENVQKICNVICGKLGVPTMTIYNFDKSKSAGARGQYFLNYRGARYAAALVDESDLCTALHELGHHIQTLLYENGKGTPHGNCFTKAIKRVSTCARSIFGPKLWPYKSSHIR